MLQQIAAAVGACAVVLTAGAAIAQDFYAGKTITMSTHTGPGGGYDTLLRLISRHLGRHIPGSPAMIVVNMPGAGGLTAFNHAARIAPQDGTYLTLVGQDSWCMSRQGSRDFRLRSDP
ncbi:MAG: efflux transporter protein [Hyphomicrobiales bacterium]|nr:efflux transporter protein [Hyphomicrobiales bacterium]